MYNHELHELQAEGLLFLEVMINLVFGHYSNFFIKEEGGFFMGHINTYCVNKYCVEMVA